MPENAKFLVELDTSQAEAALARLHAAAGGASGGGGGGGGPSGGGRTGGDTGGGGGNAWSAVHRAQAPVGPTGAAGGGGLDLIDIGTILFALKGTLSELARGMDAYLEAMNRSLQSFLGIRDDIEGARASKTAQDRTLDLGMAGAFMSPRDIERFYQQERMLSGLEERGRTNVYRATDPFVMDENEGMALLGGALLLGRKLLSAGLMR